MNECYKCGVSSEKATLYEGVSVNGIVSVCRKCFFKQKMPLIEKKEVNWSNIDTRKTVRQRLSKMSGYEEKLEENALVPTKKDKELMALVEKNFEENAIPASETPEDIISNFNWAIMRKRRSLGFSLKDLADKIYVPESVADSLERGILPRDYKSLVKKVESVLDINLFTEIKFKISPQDLAIEAKVPTGTLMTEVEDAFTPKLDNELYEKKSKPNSNSENGYSDSYEIDANDLNLENVEDMFGKPEINEKLDKNEIFENSKEKSKDVSKEDVSKFAWGN